jgi:hypothetical protein
MAKKKIKNRDGKKRFCIFKRAKERPSEKKGLSQ